MRQWTIETNSEQGAIVALFLAAVACSVLAMAMAIISIGPSYVFMAILLLAALALLFIGGVRWQKSHLPRK